MKYIRIGDKVKLVTNEKLKGLVVGIKYNYNVRIYSVKLGEQINDYYDDEIKKI